MARPAVGVSDIDDEFEVATYLCAEGYFAAIQAGDQSPMKVVKDDRALDKDESTSRNGQTWSLIPEAQLSTSSGDLRVTYDDLTYDPKTHVFKVTNLRVFELAGDGHTLAEIKATDEDGDEANLLVIRAPYCKSELASFTS